MLKKEKMSIKKKIKIKKNMYKKKYEFIKIK
jgi:hypothetical protein